MGTGRTDSETTIEDLEMRCAALRAELTAVQAALSVARTHALTRRCKGMSDAGAGERGQTEAPCPNRILPVSEMGRQRAGVVGARPGVLLQPLPLHDVLRRKWALGCGLPSVGRCADPAFVPSTAAARRGLPGSLRIFGLLIDGSPWEHDIPFSALAADGGVVIGREQGMCDLVLTDESVSRMHARLEIGVGGLVVTDLQSMNGVFINDEQIDIYSPQTSLPDGSVLTLGEVPLWVEYILPVA